MKLNEIATLYPERYVILAPQIRDERGFVCLWEILDDEKTLENAINSKTEYENMGFSGVVIYNTREDDSVSEASIVAQFLRVFYGMD